MGVGPLNHRDVLRCSPNASASDNFGNSVSSNGDTAVVGAPWADVGANPDQGATYVFTRSGSVWSEQAKLTAADGEVTDWFGDSVAVDGDTAVVGRAIAMARLLVSGDYQETIELYQTLPETDLGKRTGDPYLDVAQFCYLMADMCLLRSEDNADFGAESYLVIIVGGWLNDFIVPSRQINSTLLMILLCLWDAHKNDNRAECDP